MDDNKYLDLPNAHYGIIKHPNGENDTIEIGLVKDHRFVFYFWFNWGGEETNRQLENNIIKVPSLITIDWHRDLCAPCEIEKQDGTEDENFIDHWGNEHKIRCFDSKENLLNELLQNNINEIYFDIDLDYFTE
ncbi:hypothetical protein L5F50_00540 [Aliarcobacter butzleri]|nr:hypothetical protein [Aliarcobacter butzleri]